MVLILKNEHDIILGISIEKEMVKSSKDFIQGGSKYLKKYLDSFSEKNKITKTKIGGEPAYKIKEKIKFLNTTLKGQRIIIYKNQHIFNLFLYYNRESHDSLKIDRVFQDVIKTIKFNDFEHNISSKNTKEIIESTKAVEDAKSLMRKLKIHPNLYKYITEHDFEYLYNNMIEKLKSKDKWKRQELFKIFSKFLAKIQDGHTTVRGFFYNSLYGFPLFVNIRAGKVIVSKLGNEEIKSKDLIGAEICSINNISVEKILKEMKSLVSSDNGCENWKEARLTREFSFFMYLIYGNKEKYKIEYRSLNSNSINIIELKSGLQMKRIFEILNTKPEVNMIFSNSDTAIIEMPGFPTDVKEVDKFKDNIKNYFNKIKENKINNLIVDNRLNSGGDIRLGEYFLKYLAKFKGDVYLLIGRNTFSAGVVFSKMCKINNPKINVIGESTGGNIDAFGNNILGILHNSNIEFEVSTFYYDLIDKKFLNKQMKPDIEINIDPIKEALGEDQVMEKTLELIKEKNRRLSINKLLKTQGN